MKAATNPTAHRSRGPVLLVAATVAGVTAFAHWPALDSKAFSFDDHFYFVKNDLVRNPGWDSARRFLCEVLEPSTIGGYYQPLTMISLMIDAWMGATPTNLRPLHRTSLAIHVCNSLLAFLILHALFGHLYAAGAVALLFGVHPLTVETIPWLGERKTLLASFFAFGSIWCHVRFSTDMVVARRRGWYVGCVLLFVLALMAKPTVTPIPAVLLVMDYWPLRRLSIRSAVEKLPLFTIAGVSSVITYVSQARTAGVALPIEYGPFKIPLMICHNNFFYLWKMVIPTNLSSHYPPPKPFDLSDPSLLTCVIGSICLAAAIAVSMRWTRAGLAAWAWYFVALLPTMQIVGFSNVIASDKYFYFPSLAVMVLLCSVMVALNRRWGGAMVARGIGLAAIAVAAGFEIRGTRNYLHTAWRDSETLYGYMVNLAPRAPSLRSHFGIILQDLGRIDEALEQHRIAVEVGPERPETHNDFGNVLRAKGRIDEAIGQYLAALKIMPNYNVAHRNLGVALTEQGRIEEALAHFAVATEADPRNSESHYWWGVALLRAQRASEALEKLAKAVELRPRYAEAHCQMGICLDLLGRRDEALAQFEEAVRCDPDYAEGRYNLAQAQIARGRREAGAQQLREVLRLTPNDNEAKAALDALEQGSVRATP